MGLLKCNKIRDRQRLDGARLGEFSLTGFVLTSDKRGASTLQTFQSNNHAFHHASHLWFPPDPCYGRAYPMPVCLPSAAEVLTGWLLAATTIIHVVNVGHNGADLICSIIVPPTYTTALEHLPA